MNETVKKEEVLGEPIYVEMTAGLTGGSTLK